MNFKLIHQCDFDNFKDQDYMAGELIKYIFEDGSFQFAAEINYRTGCCDCCSGFTEAPTRVEVYEVI